MIEIETLRTMNCAERIAITEHARIRLFERDITIDDVISCINSGEVIRQYEDDRPFPSCLILGISAHGRPIHVVASDDGDLIHLITAYYPNTDKWEPDLRTRKEHRS